MADEETGNGPEIDPAAGASRRDFLRTAGIGLGGFAAGGAVVAGAQGAINAGKPVPGFDPLDPRYEPGFDHVVVLMFENRSFDNILGFLYQNDELPAGVTFDGLNQGSYSNTAPDGTVIPAHAYEGATDKVMRQPQPDPGEHYPHVNTQVFGIVDPDTNADLHEHPLEAPYNAPSKQDVPTMSGFVHDYIINFKELKKGKEPSADEQKVAMGGFTPEMLPVFSAIAKGFAVYDAWHAGVPSQTFCNRSFFHASTSHGFVDEQGSRRLRQVDRRSRRPRRSSTASRTLGSAGGCTTTSTRWSRSRACCTPRCSSRTGSRTSAAWSSSTTTRRTATCRCTRSSSRG